MSKAKFQVAQQFITEGKHDEARTILKSIAHPKAREWESRLDKLAPKKSKKGTYVKLALIAIGITIVVMFFVLDNKRASDNMTSFKEEQALNKRISDLQSCILQYPDNSRLVEACMSNKGH